MYPGVNKLANMKLHMKYATSRIRTIALVTAVIVAFASKAISNDRKPVVSVVQRVNSTMLVQAESDILRSPGRCKLSGCSHEICADENVITPCIWRPEYGCYKKALCEVQSNGSCDWTKTPGLEDCLANSKGLNRGK